MSRRRNGGCEEIRPLLVDHLSGAGARQHDRVERHLAGCEACRAEAGFIRLLQRSVPDYLPGPRLGFEKRLEAVVTAAEERSDPRHLRRTVGLRLLAGVTVGVTLLSGVLPSTSEILAAVAGIGWQGAGVLLGASALVLLVSSPLLFARHRRMEDLS